MKTFKEITKKIGTLTELDKQKIRELTKELEAFNSKNTISIEGLKTLFNLQTSLFVLIEQYNDRLLNLLKQQHMVD